MSTQDSIFLKLAASMSSSQPQPPCKNVLGHRYFYVDAFDFLSSDISEKLVAAEKLARVTRMQHFNVARF